MKLAERFDLACISSKGQSVGACRHLVDDLCGQWAVPLFVLHDSDKTGFSILKGLRQDSEVYQFRHDFEVIDLGLRLEDVEECGLESEVISYPSNPAPNLIRNGASEEEVAFLRGQRNGKRFEGRRVELNAFTSRDLVDWLERKLEAHGVERVMPNSEELEKLYRRALEISLINRDMPTLAGRVAQAATATDLPDDLDYRVKTRMAESPDQP